MKDSISHFVHKARVQWHAAIRNRKAYLETGRETYRDSAIRMRASAFTHMRCARYIAGGQYAETSLCICYYLPQLLSEEREAIRKRNWQTVKA